MKVEQWSGNAKKVKKVKLNHITSMKRIFYVIFLFAFLSCNHSSKQQNVNAEISDKTATEKVVAKSIDYPVCVEYTSEHEPDTMFVTLNDEKFLITPEGKVKKKDGTLFFNIHCDNLIEQLYFFRIDNDWVAVYEDTDMDCTGNVVERIDVKNNKSVWKVYAGGFNSSKPVRVDNNVYISTIGFVGKLDISTGKYQWQYDNLYRDGKYNSFDETKFLNANEILFRSVNPMNETMVDSIIIDDKTGKIIRKD